MPDATFDLHAVTRKICAGPTGRTPRTLDRDAVEILAGALLSHLDLLDAKPEPKIGDIVRVTADEMHGIADGALGEVVGAATPWGALTVRAVVTRASQCWDGYAGEVQRQHVRSEFLEVVAPAPEPAPLKVGDQVRITGNTATRHYLKVGSIGVVTVVREGRSPWISGLDSTGKSASQIVDPADFEVIR